MKQVQHAILLTGNALLYPGDCAAGNSKGQPLALAEPVNRPSLAPKCQEVSNVMLHDGGVHRQQFVAERLANDFAQVSVDVTR